MMDFHCTAHNNSNVCTKMQGWLAIASAKQAYFHCVAQHRLGLVAQAKKNHGESVARMKRAMELLSESEKKGEGVFKPYVRLRILLEYYQYSLDYSSTCVSPL